MSKPALIAIVDDEPSILRALARLFRSHDLLAETFPDGRALLARMEEDGAFRPDCVLLDIHLPGMSGIEVQEELRHLQTGVPIIFITAISDSPLRRRAMAGGASSVLQKPLREEALLQAVRDACGCGGMDPPPAGSA